MNSKKMFSVCLFCFTLVIFYLPIFIIVIYSFNSGKGVTWEGFGLKWYTELFTESNRLLASLWNSFIIGIISALLSTFLGSLGAWAIWNSNHKIKHFLLSLSYMSLMLPDLIMGVSLLILFVVMTIPLGMGTIFIAHTTMTIPFSLLLILSILDSSDLSVLEASKDLGASEWQTWLRVLIPILSPGLIASFLLSLTLSLDDFAITFFVSGSGSTTLPIYVYSALRFGLTPAVNALSALIIGVSVILFSLNKKYLEISFK